MCAQLCVIPAPGDLLRREGPGLLVLFGVAERLYDDFSTLHSGETTQLESLTFLYQQTCLLKKESMWHYYSQQAALLGIWS